MIFESRNTSKQVIEAMSMKKLDVLQQYILPLYTLSRCRSQHSFSHSSPRFTVVSKHFPSLLFIPGVQSSNSQKLDEDPQNLHSDESNRVFQRRRDSEPILPRHGLVLPRPPFYHPLAHFLHREFCCTTLSLDILGRHKAPCAAIIKAMCK